MRIGIDIDNVISNFNDELLKEYLEHDKKLRNTGIINENPHHITQGMFDWTKEENDDFYYNNIERIAKKLKPLSRAAEIISKLKNENNVFDVDVTKLIINVNNSGITGKQLGDILRYKYNIEVEMDSLKYVLGITTICDDYKELERLAEALKEIDKSLEEKQNENISVELLKNKRMYSIYETDLKEKNTVNLFDSKDCISGEFVFLYPPGIPLVVPGEVITEELLEQIKVYLEANMNISGLKDNSNKTIEVVK